MTWDESGARSRARAAYEQSRFLTALWVLWLVVPLVVAGLCLSENPGWSGALGLLLVGLTVAARWRGGIVGGASTTGVIAGLPAYVIPAVGMWGTGACDGACCTDWCLTLCSGGGIITGLLVGMYAATRPRDRVVHAAVGAAVSALTAAVACSAWGWAATGTMAATALILAGGVTLLVPNPRAA